GKVGPGGLRERLCHLRVSLAGGCGPAVSTRGLFPRVRAVRVARATALGGGHAPDDRRRPGPAAPTRAAAPKAIAGRLVSATTSARLPDHALARSDRDANRGSASPRPARDR